MAESTTWTPIIQGGMQNRTMLTSGDRKNTMVILKRRGLCTVIDVNNLPQEITSHVIKFKDFLVSSWPHLDSLMEEHDWHADTDFMDDWLTTNWELLIERELLGRDSYLASPMIPQGRRKLPGQARPQYYIGAELAGSADKLSREESETVEAIKLCSQLRLVYFGVKLPEGGYGWYPPFDHVLIYSEGSKKRFQLPITYFRYYLRKIDY